MCPFCNFHFWHDDCRLSPPTKVPAAVPPERVSLWLTLSLFHHIEQIWFLVLVSTLGSHNKQRASPLWLTYTVVMSPQLPGAGLQSGLL